MKLFRRAAVSAAAAIVTSAALIAPAAALNVGAVVDQGISTVRDSLQHGAADTVSSVVGDGPAHAYLAGDPANRYIVVLGARLNNDGTMPEVLNARLDKTAAIARAHPGTDVITTGGPTAPLPYTEAQAMLAGLTLRGVNPANIITENDAMSTVGNARNVSGILSSRGADGAVLVSSDSHFPRALDDFESAMPGTTFVPVGVAGW
ncbi:MAG: YdcF family protein [Tomitella sp.]|nr:YdcF family protein [Tomitella sp.]